MSEQTLREYIRSNTLPARVKVTGGIYVAGWEFSNGDVLDLHKIVCPSVQLAFVHPDTGEERTLSVSTQSSCLFKIMPYIPGRPIHLNKAMVIHGTTELMKIWPTVVCARSSYSDYGLDIEKGEKLRPKRMLQNDGMFLLECSRQNSQLVRLPLTCDLEYLLVEDTMTYTLEEISKMQGRVERRIHQSDDNINKTHPIPGLPRDLTSDMIMAPPQRFVEIHPADSPGEQIVAPIDVDISVCDRDMDYTGIAFAWYSFQQFVDANSSQFPMVVAIADWEDESVTVQAIRASVGDRIVLHKMEEVLKASCQVGSSYFVIPLTYDAAFEFKPRIFSSIEDVCNNKVKKVKVIGDARSREPGLSGVCKGEILEILSTKSGGKTSGVVTVRKGGAGFTDISLRLRGQYEEIIGLPADKRASLKHISQAMLPLTVVFHEPSASIPPSRDRLPRGEEVIIRTLFSDSCVRASKDTERGFSSPLPTRTGISVRYISQYKSIPAPDMSFLAICPEEITEEKLLTLPTDIPYVNVDSLPEEVEPPPLMPRKASLATNNMPLDRSTSACYRPRDLPDDHDDGYLHALPVHLVKSTNPPGQVAAAKPITTTVKRSISAPTPPLPPRATPALPGTARTLPGTAPNPTKTPPKHDGHRPKSKRTGTSINKQLPEPPMNRVTEDELLYEDVNDLAPGDYKSVMSDIFGKDEPPSITTPANGNISSFSWQDMVVFLQLNGMPLTSLRLFARDKLSGADFAVLDNSQLVTYGINNTIIRHYRFKSKNHGPLTQYL